MRRAALLLGLANCGVAPPDPIAPDPDVLFIDSIERGAIVHVHGAAEVIGGMVISGTAFEPANEYVWHVRVDNDGRIRWRRQFDLLGASPACCVSTGATTDGSVMLDADDNLVVFDADGFIVSSATLPVGPVRGRPAATSDGGLVVPLGNAIATISPMGAVTRQLAGTQLVATLAAAGDGGLFAFGQTATAPWIARLDPVGVPIWQLSGGALGDTRSPGSIEPTADGGALVLVNANPPWLARLDPTGAIVWQKHIQYTIALPDPPDAIRALQQADGTIVVFGKGNATWVLLVDGTGTLLGDRRLARTPSDAVVINGEVTIFGQLDNARGLLYRPRDLSAGPCGGGLGATSLELVDAAESLAPIDLGFAAVTPATPEPSNILSRASDVELSTSCE